MNIIQNSKTLMERQVIETWTFHKLSTQCKANALPLSYSPAFLDRQLNMYIFAKNDMIKREETIEVGRPFQFDKVVPVRSVILPSTSASPLLTGDSELHTCSAVIRFDRLS